MSRTLDSVRDKKFVAETLKRALAAQSPLAFFCVLKHQEDKKPVLLLGNPDAELKRVALQPAAQIIKGRCRKGADGVEFYTDDADDEMKFKEAIRKVAKDAGLTPFDAILKPASALGEEGGTAQNQTLDQLAETAKAEVQSSENTPNLTFSKDSWVKFSATWSKRSPELKAIDVAFDGVAGATDLKSQISAGVALGKAIKTWVDLKQGDSRRLAMVSTLREQVTAQVAAWELKDLTNKANEFKARFAGQPGNDLEAEKGYLDQLVNDLSGIAKSPAFHDAKCDQLALALQKAASAKFQEMVDLTELKEFQAARQPLLDGPILSAPTRELIKRLATAGKSLEAKELVDALFEDFCAYGRAHWKYDTKANKDSNLLAGAKTGACGTFSTQFAKLVNIIVGKKIASFAAVTAQNFITVPLKTVRFIDPACPGNLKMSPGAEPDRYFYTGHYITETPVGKYCPTTGTKDAAVAAVVAQAGFKKVVIDKQEAYELGAERITVELDKGYGKGSLYTLQKIQ